MEFSWCWACFVLDFLEESQFVKYNEKLANFPRAGQLTLRNARKPIIAYVNSHVVLIDTTPCLYLLR